MQLAVLKSTAGKSTCEFVAFVPILFEGWKRRCGWNMLIPADLVLHMQCKPLKFRATITFLSVLDPEAQQQFGGEERENGKVDKRRIISCS